jgi:hypothetical protein
MGEVNIEEWVRRSPRLACLFVAEKMGDLAHDIGADPPITKAEARRGVEDLRVALMVLSDRLPDDDAITGALTALLGEGSPTDRNRRAVGILRGGDVR